MIMNNISKAFNGRILKAKNNPIISIIKWIRCYWMRRFVENKAIGEVYKGKVNPKPRKRLNVEVCEIGK